MKMLLVLSMLLTSAFAGATPEWFVNCYDKNNQQQEYDLAWKIGVNNAITLWRCDDKNPECEQNGYLRVDRRQDETCLEAFHPGSMDVNHRWELCHTRQETDILNPRRLVPVTIRSEHQESAAYCEKSIFKVLYSPAE